MKEFLTLETITQAHHFLGLEQPRHPLISVYRHNNERLRLNYAGFRLTFGFFQIVLKDGHEGSMGYGRNSYDFQDGTMMFLSPGQVLAPDNYEYNENNQGWAIIFHPDLIRKSELGSKIDSYSFFSYDVHEALHVSQDEKKSLTELTYKIEKEYNQNIDKHSQKIIVSNVELLLDYCTRYYDRQFYTRSDMHKDVVSKFETFIKDYYHSDKPSSYGVPTVKNCGIQLNMSPNYLSDLLKKETGRNAQEHIHDFVINRAKNSLLGSTRPIGQIAYDLGFEYPQHFSKVFKSKTGMSPSEYRSVDS